MRALERERRRMQSLYTEEPGPNGPVETCLELADELGALAQKVSAAARKSELK